MLACSDLDYKLFLALEKYLQTHTHFIVLIISRDTPFLNWRLIGRLSILPPGHWTCSFVCHFNSRVTYSPASISILPRAHLHLSEVMHVRVKCLAQGHNFKTMSTALRGETHGMCLKPAPSGDWTSTTDISYCIKAPRPNHIAACLY